MRRPTKARPGSRKRNKALRAAKRRAKREFTRVCQSSRAWKHRLNYLTLESGGREWKPKTIDLSRDKPHRSISVRRSERWLPRHKFPTTCVGLPIIDKVGRFTGYNAYRVNTSPAVLLGTTITTIYRRVYALVVRRYGRSKKTQNQWSDLLARCSAYYALTKDVYFWDRLLPLLRKGDRKLLSSVLHHRTVKLDDYKWFVYSHACLQTKWLTFRALGPRDKSSYVRGFFFRNDSVPEKDSRSQFEYDAMWHCFTGVSSLHLSK